MGRPPKLDGHDPVVPVRLPNDMIEEIDATAEAMQSTRSKVIREALRRGLKAIKRSLVGR